MHKPYNKRNNLFSHGTPNMKKAKTVKPWKLRRKKAVKTCFKCGTLFHSKSCPWCRNYGAYQ
jgi:recombinational DNA repair protein RecR